MRDFQHIKVLYFDNRDSKQSNSNNPNFCSTLLIVLSVNEIAMCLNSTRRRIRDQSILSDKSFNLKCLFDKQSEWFRWSYFCFL